MRKRGIKERRNKDLKRKETFETEKERDKKGRRNKDIEEMN